MPTIGAYNKNILCHLVHQVENLSILVPTPHNWSNYFCGKSKIVFGSNWMSHPTQYFDGVTRGRASDLTKRCKSNIQHHFRSALQSTVLLETKIFIAEYVIAF